MKWSKSEKKSWIQLGRAFVHITTNQCLQRFYLNSFIQREVVLPVNVEFLFPLDQTEFRMSQIETISRKKERQTFRNTKFL